MSEKPKNPIECYNFPYDEPEPIICDICGKTPIGKNHEVIEDIKEDKIKVICRRCYLKIFHELEKDSERYYILT